MKATSNTFVLELPLVFNPNDDRVLWSRMEAGRRLYNAILHEALTRLSVMRKSIAWENARLISDKKDRNKAFSDAQKSFQLYEYALHSFAAIVREKSGWNDRLGSHEVQKVASRVWKSVSEYAFGAKGKPRFKGFNRPVHSLESKTNAAGIRFKPELGAVLWNGLVLPIKYQHNEYVDAALNSKTKYCRIVWKNIKGNRRWYVQLMQQGVAPQRFEFSSVGNIGLDLGPSTIAIYSNTFAGLEQFASSVEQPWREIKVIQRALDRSRRETNPENYNPNGTVKNGARKWVRSSRYRELQIQLSEMERKLAAARKRDHGELCNKIVSIGNNIQTENISYKSFQKIFGKSVKVRAPGMFIELLKRKAESAGGKVVELNTVRLRMSQFNHETGTCIKKPLSQRFHELENTVVQRDIYSAFLACHARDNEHNLSRLKSGWATAEPLLLRTGLCKEKSASGMVKTFPLVAIPTELIVRKRALGMSQDLD